MEVELNSFMASHCKMVRIIIAIIASLVMQALILYNKRIIRCPSEALRRFYAQGRIEFHAGLDVWIRDVGDGPIACVCLHGFPVSSFDFSRVISAWEKSVARCSRRIIAFDFIGFGASAEAPNDLDFDLQTDILESILAHRDLDLSTRVVILAHDYGCTVAQELFARLRERSRPVPPAIFLNAGLIPEAHRPTGPQLMAACLPRLTGCILDPFFLRVSLSRLFLAPLTMSDVSDMWHIMSRHKLTLFHRLNYMYHRRTNRTRWIEALVYANESLIVLIGRQDPVSGESVAAAVTRHSPRVRVKWIESAGHWPHWERPDVVRTAIVNLVVQREKMYSMESCSR